MLGEWWWDETSITCYGMGTAGSVFQYSLHEWRPYNDWLLVASNAAYK